ncbi:MAG: hypothetical protein Q8S84_06430 [bacterium]|nr:hypothetical protein [bacterium]
MKTVHLTAASESLKYCLKYEFSPKKDTIFDQLLPLNKLKFIFI